jgi:MFS transporter, FSR family, fosmidomycin resistance protein
MSAQSHVARAAVPIASGTLGWLMFSHFSNDIYVNYLPALLPILSDAHHLTLGQAGLLVSIATIAGSVFQPVFGYLADSTRLGFMAPIGLACTALGSALLGVAPSYAWLVAVVILHGFGMAAFHPPSAGLVHEVSGARKGTAMAGYGMAGQVGQSISPIFAASVAVAFGLPWLAATAIPAVFVSLWLMRTVPWDLRATKPREASVSLGVALRTNATGLARLMGLLLSRATLSHCMMALLPFLFRARGAPVTVGAAAITAMVFAGAMSGLVAGTLSDRYGRRRVLFTSFALATPLFLAALHTSGLVSIVLFALGGGALFGSSYLMTVEAQSLLPAHASMAAGIMMGVGMGVGGLLVGPVSALAERIGIVPVLTAVSLLPLPGSILTLSLAGPATSAVRAPATAAASTAAATPTTASAPDAAASP